MKVVVHPADTGGCGSYRCIWPGRALKAQGHDVTVDFDRTYKALWQPTAFGDRIIDLAQTIDADVVVLQRPLHRNRYELLQALQANGVAVVVEVDDDFHAIHPKNPAWKGTHPLENRDANRDWLAKACDAADLVTVTTPALERRYGAHGRCAVLSNYVPEQYLTLDATANEPPVVGWSGSVATHPGDLEVTRGAVAEAVVASDARFRVVGTGVGVARALGLLEEPDATTWLPIDQYPQALAGLDVGIVPLKLNDFNEAKSWLKGLEFAAVGVPFVASPTGPYRALAEGFGAGEIAETPDDWYDQLRRLLTDPGWRAERAAAGRKAAQSLTIEANAWRWAAAWAQAVHHRSGTVAA